MGGIVCGDLFSTPSPVLLWAIAGLFLLIAFGFFHRPVSPFFFGGTIYLLLFIIGFSITCEQLQRSNYSFSSKGEAVYRVILVERPEIKGRSLLYHARLQAQVERDSLFYNPSPAHCLLYFPKDSAAMALQRGDELWIYAPLSPPANRGNPGEFDYARFLRRKGICGTAYVASGHWKVIGHNPNRTFRQIFSDYRERVIDYYQRMGFKGDELALLSALTIGYKEGLSESISETYAATGAGHVLALSGLHIGFLYALLFFLFAPLWRRWSRLKLPLMLLIILLLGAFAFFTGLSSSVVRAVVMCSLLLLSQLQYHQPFTPNILASAAFGMLLFRPLWLFDIGFQLSFTAVAAIIWLQPKLYSVWKPKNRLLQKGWGLVTLSLAAQAGTFPLVIFYFSRFSTHFLWTNLWIIPLVSLVIYGGVLLLLFAPFSWVAHALATLLQILIRIQNGGLRYIQQLPYATIDRIHWDLIELLLYYLCLFLWVRGFFNRTAGNLSWALLSLLLCLSYQTFSTLERAPRKSLYIYNQSNAPAVHCLTNGSLSWLVCADTLTDTSGLSRRLAPFWNSMHLKPPKLLVGEYSDETLCFRDHLLFYGGKRICLLFDDCWRNKTADVPLFVDYLYLTRGYSGNLHELTPLFTIGRVILDASLSSYYKDKIIRECIQWSIPYFSLSERGAMRIKL